MHDENVLEVNNLKKYFPVKRGLLRRVVGNKKAVDDVSFNVKEGETFGLVGESGCGKSTTALSILRGFEPTDGEVFYETSEGDEVEIVGLKKDQLKDLRKEIQVIFQDPYSSLNPRMSIRDIVGDPLIVNNIAKGKELDRRVGDLLEQVELKEEYMNRYPHAFSGGQRQRIGIARALSVNPRFVACDEPVSALDVSVQAQILNLLNEIQREYNLTYLFIAHDLSVIKHICDRVAVMYAGKIVELTGTGKLFNSPLHPYTEALLSAVPKTDPEIEPDRILLRGEVPDPANKPSGCLFHPRCQYAKSICEEEVPEFKETSDDESVSHFVSCHFAEELDLSGVIMKEQVS